MAGAVPPHVEQQQCSSKAGLLQLLAVLFGDCLHSAALAVAHAVLCDVLCVSVQVWLTIQRPGVFYGQCSELCGANHAFMPIVVEAVTPRQVRHSRQSDGLGAVALTALMA
jgi:hypothetical protein